MSRATGVPRATAAVPARARARMIAAAVGVLLLGAVVRIAFVLHGGGLLAYGAYDDGVYYTAAVRLLHGSLPYRDYLFLQPPGVVVVLAPFALAARAVGDPAALVALRLAFEVLGGINAALVLVALRRFGLTAGLLGGVVYAVLYPAVFDERTALLEPIGTTGLLVALIALDAARSTIRPGRWYLLAGAALGIGIDLKIWVVVPLAVVLVFARGGRVRVLLGAAVTVVVCFLPFCVPAPVASFREIVLDQIGRGRTGALPQRAEIVLGVQDTGRYSAIPGVPPADAAVVALVLLVAGCLLLIRDPRCRIHLALLAATAAVVMAAPDAFEHYAGLTSAPLALVTGLALDRLVRGVRRRPVRIAAIVAALVVIAAAAVRHDVRPVDRPAPAAALQAAARQVAGCIYSDDPTVLAIMDVLTRDVDRGCAVQPDMSGLSFDPAGYPPGGRGLDRTANPVYQDAARAYLESGAAFLAVRAGAQLSAGTLRGLGERPVLARAGRLTVRAGLGR